MSANVTPPVEEPAGVDDHDKPKDLLARLDGIAGIVDMAWREITPSHGHLGSALWLAAQELQRMRLDLEEVGYV